VDFQISNAYFQVGERNLQQKIGVPMGAMALAALAVLDSIWQENEHREMWEWKEVAIHRFRDDIWLLVRGEARREGGEAWLHQLQ